VGNKDNDICNSVQGSSWPELLQCAAVKTYKENAPVGLYTTFTNTDNDFTNYSTAESKSGFTYNTCNYLLTSYLKSNSLESCSVRCITNYEKH
jgi:hypothetical protein